MRIVFFGTPTFAETILNTLIDHKIDIVAVVTRPDKPKGRSKKLKPPPVKACAQKRLPAVPLHQPTKASTPEFAETLKALNADLFVVVAYGEIIKQFLLDIPPLGCINVHFSLLPKYRGAAPMQHALLHGDVKTGVTIIKMVMAMDAGPILAQAEMDVSLDLQCGELAEKLCAMGGELLLNVIKNIKTITPTIQDESQVTLAPKIKPEHAKIDWSQSALSIHNQVRALNPAPGAWTTVELNGETKRLKILRSKPLSENIEAYDKQGWIVSCGEGSLQLLEIQLEGKKPMLAKAFMAGVRQIKILKLY